MSILITIVSFLAVLVLVIIAHELGHFVTAKLSKVRVDEVGLGFPPRLLSFKRGETIYSLNLIPLGGFCRMAGEEDPNVPGGLAVKGIGARLLVLSAGSIMMLLLPLLLLPAAYMIPMERYLEGEGVQVVNVARDSPAEEAGILPGDVIKSADGQPIHNFDELKDIIDSNLGFEIGMLLLRDSTEVEVTLVPRPNPPEGEGPVGVELGPITETRAYPPWKAIPLGLGQYGQMLVAMKNAIASTVQGEEELAVIGPVGIAQLTGEVAQRGAYSLIRFIAFLSLILAIVNILPIPALDGGRIAFVFLEVVRRGKRIPPKKEALINTIGFALLMLLVVVISYYDILRLIRGEGFGLP